MGDHLMVPLFEQNLLGLQNIPRQFFLQVYHTFLHIGETRYLLAFLLPSRPPCHPHLHSHPGVAFVLSHMGPWEKSCRSPCSRLDVQIPRPGQTQS